MRAIGSRPGYILPRCVRLARVPGIFSLDARDWLVSRVYSPSMRAIDSRPGYILPRRVADAEKIKQ
eukprot:2881876-Pyramimonas_sp.AAC.1